MAEFQGRSVYVYEIDASVRGTDTHILYSAWCQGAGGFGATYTNTTHVKIGDLGSGLPHTPSGVTWQAGTAVEVAWTLQANHGGGYSYRLCPLSEELTEDCFQKHPLDFFGPSTFRWGGEGGPQVTYTPTIVSEGTTPLGSQWAKNPIPRAWKDAAGNWGRGSNHLQTGYGFQPFCEDKGEDPNGNETSCTGMWGVWRLFVDTVPAVANRNRGYSRSI